MPCLDDLTLANLVGNNLPAERHAEAMSHVDGCARCYELVAELVRGRTHARLAPGTVVGRYVVEHVVGAGAMGVVYAAHDPELDRKVALKLVRSAASERAAERMRREAQVMAQLSHPNVVAIFDVGTFGDEVFLAMEYVAGQTLREWLAETPRSRAEVIAALVAAGRGLAAAHEVGIVHRDFKPDNVLVATSGRVCVTDFGLARAADEPADQAVDARGTVIDAHRTAPGGIASHRVAAVGSAPPTEALTRTGALVGTPAYMAPEQLAGAAADARADQFALCVVLYEALTGRRPFAGDTLAELRSAIRETAVAADARVPAYLQRAIARGLAPDPGARFASLDELVATIARDPAVRRRRIAIGVSALAASMIVGLALPRGSAAAEPCPDASERLAGAWDGALRERIKAGFAATGKPYAAAMATTAAAALDRYARAWTELRADRCRATYVQRDQSEARYDAEVACLDRRRAELAAIVQLLADQPDDAIVQKAPSLVPSIAALAPCRDGDTTPLPANLGERTAVTALDQSVATAQALANSGKLGAATRLIDDVVARARSIGYAPTLAHALYARGMLATYRPDAKAAEQALYESAELAAHTKDDELVARDWTLLVYVLGSIEHKLDESRSVGKVAWTAVQRAGERDPLVIQWHNSTGAVAIQAGKGDEAIKEFSAALAVAERATPPDDNLIADELSKLAIGYVAAGKNAEARAPLERSLQILERTRGPDHPDVAFGLEQTGGILYDAGKYDEAKHDYERALAIWNELGEPASVKTSEAIEGIANCEAALGAYTDSLAHYQRVLAIREPLMGADDPHVGDTHANLAQVYDQLGRQDDAKREARRALDIYRKVYGEKHPMVATALRNLGMLEMGTPDAVRDLKAAVALATETLGPDHPEVGVDLGNLGNAYVQLHQLDAAREPLEQALAHNEKAYGPDHEYTALARVAVAQVELELGDAHEAIELLERADASLAATHALPKRRALPRTLLAQAYWHAGDHAKARELAKQALADFTGALDTESQQMKRELTDWIAKH